MSDNKCPKCGAEFNEAACLFDCGSDIVCNEFLESLQCLRNQNAAKDEMIKKLQMVYCAGCGEGIVNRNDSDYADKMVEHITSCDKHPIIQLRNQNASLKMQLEIKEDACQGFIDGWGLARDKNAELRATLDAIYRDVEAAKEGE